jgi:hypothetical protein
MMVEAAGVVLSTAFRMCKLLILLGPKMPKVPHSRVHRTPIVHGVSEHKANYERFLVCLYPKRVKAQWLLNL